MIAVLEVFWVDATAVVTSMPHHFTFGWYQGISSPVDQLVGVDLTTAYADPLHAFCFRFETTILLDDTLFE